MKYTINFYVNSRIYSTVATDDIYTASLTAGEVASSLAMVHSSCYAEILCNSKFEPAEVYCVKTFPNRKVKGLQCKVTRCYIGKKPVYTSYDGVTTINGVRHSYKTIHYVK